MNGIISLTFGGFPNGYCYPGDPNDFANDLLNSTIVTFNTSTANLFYNFGDTIPSVDNRIYPWYRTGASGADGWYYWSVALGYWVQPHPVPVSSDERRLYVGSEASLLTYDGGANEVVGNATGPFWEVDHDFDFRFPLGPGTSPDATVVAVGGTGGEENHALTEAELAEHSHILANSTAVELPPNPLGVGDYITTEGVARVGSDYKYSLEPSPNDPDVGLVGLTGSGDGHNTMPPYRGVFFIKRTARIYRRV